jgi:hypothetical protein
MSGKPSNAREALLAELLGDVQALLVRLEQADQSAKETANAVREATAQYRAQVDELVSKLRAETAAIVLRTTEHAARTLVGQQQATLQKAATLAMQHAITAQVLRRTRRDWLMAAALGALSGSALTIVLFTLRAWLFGH